jgi:glyoxylase-like metal-dependent hydrolase (beta-lactamase superfamily II)
MSRIEWTRRAFVGVMLTLQGLAGGGDLHPVHGACIERDGSPVQRSAIDAAVDALGARAVNTLQFTASGATFTVGQNFTPEDPWPRVMLRRYSVFVDYEHTRMRQELVRVMGPTMPRGGGVPFTGELRQAQLSDTRSAWDIPGSVDPSASSLPVAPCTPPEAGGTAPTAAPSPASQIPCTLMLWSTPHGFLKAAQAHDATMTPSREGTAVSFAIDSTHRMTGVIDAKRHVRRVQTWTAQSIVGDMLVETLYESYRDFGGVQFPSHIVQKQDGFPSLDLTVTAVAVNRPVDVSPPEEATSATVPPPVVKSQEIADGVFWLAGGTHHSLAIAMRDHIVLVDTPNGEARASAVIAKAKELIPNKPIRYVVAMHHHWDHLGGIRTAIDEGATIVTHRSNRAFLERAATAPHTIAPDRLSKSKRSLILQAVDAEGTLTDGTRVVKLYTMTGFDHTADTLMVYLPNEKLLAEADAYTPPDTPMTPLIAPKVPYAAALDDNIRRLKLDVQTIVPFHGMRTADRAEVTRQARRRPE